MVDSDTFTLCKKAFIYNLFLRRHAIFLCKNNSHKAAATITCTMYLKVPMPWNLSRNFVSYLWNFKLVWNLVPKLRSYLSPMILISWVYWSCIFHRDHHHWSFLGLKALANEDTLLPTRLFPRLPMHATFVADTKKCSWFVFRNILCRQQMFPSLCSPRNIMGNSVSAIMCPCLPEPLLTMSKIHVYSLTDALDNLKQFTSTKEMVILSLVLTALYVTGYWMVLSMSLLGIYRFCHFVRSSWVNMAENGTYVLSYREIIN